MLNEKKGKKKIDYTGEFRRPAFPISTNLPKQDYEDFTLLVKHGYFMNNSEGLRYAVKLVLREFRSIIYELRDKKEESI